MIFNLHQNQFESLGQWFAWRAGLDLADFCAVVPPGMAENHAAELRASETALHQFFQDLLVDLYSQPKAYGVPEVPYEPTVPEDNACKERLREGRLKVRKVIENGLLDTLYQLGRMGEPENQALRVNPSFYAQLVAEKKKKVKTTAFLLPLERLGLVIAPGEDTVVITNQRYPGMMAGLSAFARQCAQIKDLDFYFFRRCDFAVFEQKCLPVFEEALRQAPEALRGEIVKMDALLCERKFKRDILVANADSGYRLRYSKKGDAMVYWCRIRAWSSQDLTHSLRWNLTGMSPALFARLDETTPGLAERVFNGVKTCVHDYEPCMVRVLFAYKDSVKEACQEAGWEIGETPTDFENLRTVICLLDELVSGKRD